MMIDSIAASFSLIYASIPRFCGMYLEGDVTASYLLAGFSLIFVTVSLGLVIKASTSLLNVLSVYLMLLLFYLDFRSFLLELQ